MKFLPIPYDIRHWGGLLPEPYHTFEHPRRECPSTVRLRASYRIDWGGRVVEANASFHHVPHWHL